MKTFADLKVGDKYRSYNVGINTVYMKINDNYNFDIKNCIVIWVDDTSVFAIGSMQRCYDSILVEELDCDFKIKKTYFSDLKPGDKFTLLNFSNVFTVCESPNKYYAVDFTNYLVKEFLPTIEVVRVS